MIPPDFEIGLSYLLKSGGGGQSSPPCPLVPTAMVFAVHVTNQANLILFMQCASKIAITKNFSLVLLDIIFDL